MILMPLPGLKSKRRNRPAEFIESNTMVYKINSGDLTPEIIKKLVENNGKLTLSVESTDLINRCRQYLDRKLENTTEPLYGITTGFGSLHNRIISSDQLNKLQENLVMSHACGMGDRVRGNIVRTMLLLKIHALSKGLSGVQ